MTPMRVTATAECGAVGDGGGAQHRVGEKRQQSEAQGPLGHQECAHRSDRHKPARRSDLDETGRTKKTARRTGAAGHLTDKHLLLPERSDQNRDQGRRVGDSEGAHAARPRGVCHEYRGQQQAALDTDLSKTEPGRVAQHPGDHRLRSSRRGCRVPST
jgi:hypothetical protein